MSELYAQPEAECPVDHVRRASLGDPIVEAHALARRLADESDDTVEAVVLYGSHLHGAAPDRHSALDLVVIVSDYGRFYRALEAAGRLRRPAWLLSTLAHVLPPNSIAYARDAARSAIAKCLVVSRMHLVEALGPHRKDHLLLARLIQRVVVVWARSPETGRWVDDRLDDARASVLGWLAPFLDEPFDAESMGRRMLEVSYGAELRPEAVDRAVVIFESQRDYLRGAMSSVLRRHATAGDLTSEGAGYRFVKGPSRRQRLRGRWYFSRSKARTTARWLKHVVTFDDWLPYLTRKVERRTGQPVHLSSAEKRWPLVFLWPRAIRVLRTRPEREQAQPALRAPVVRACGVRETIAFIRDPAAFTAGPGLRLGDFYRVRVPRVRLHVVTDPALTERILVTEAASFEKSRIYWRELRQSFGESMGALDGERWEYLHRVQRPFFTPRAVDTYLPAVERLVTLQLQTLADGLEDHHEVRLMDVLTTINARIVLSVLFGQDVEREPLERARELADRIADGHAIIAWRSRFPWRPFTGWLSGVNRRGDAHKTYFEAFAQRLGQSSAASDPRVLLHALMRIPCDPDAPGYSDSLLRNEVVFHLGASTETQAAAEGWALYLLGRAPHELQRIREEIARVTGDALVSARHVPELTYTKQVLEETLRLYPPIHAVVRDCRAPADLKRHHARAGETFLISVYGLHRNPRLWRDPDRFDPDRFHRGMAGAIGRYQYLPFGAGRHVCIGQHLALPSMILTVAQFAQRFDWTFSDHDVRPLAVPSLKPSGSFRVRLTRRC